MTTAASDATIGRIPLYGKSGIVEYAFVDIQDYHEVSQYRWNLGGKYATTSLNGIPTRMQFLVMKIEKVKGKVLDHIDGNKLNNRRNNLRHATITENNQNSVGKCTSLSGYRGVIKYKTKTPYMAKITYKKVQYNMGSFAKAIDAAKKYDTFAFRLYGKHAMTNNLLTAEEISECLKHPLTEDGMQVFRRKIREFPVGVKKLPNGEFKAMKGKVMLGTFKTVQAATNARTEFDKKQKKENEASHNSLDIERNSMGQAVIPLRDFAKTVIAYAIVDDDEWHRLAKHSWCSVNKRYAVSKINNENIFMHQVLLPGHDVIDHINHNGLDNRKENLRPTDASGNAQNRPKAANCASIYKGVWYSKEKKKWAADIKKNYIKYRLGYFMNEKDAALAYNKKALELYDKPLLNMIE